MSCPISRDAAPRDAAPLPIYSESFLRLAFFMLFFKTANKNSPRVALLVGMPPHSPYLVSLIRLDFFLSEILALSTFSSPKQRKPFLRQEQILI